MRRKALRTLLIVATTIALVGCGHKNDHNGIEVVETPLEETEPFSEEPEVVVEEEPLYVAPERLPEWDEPSDYLRIQIDDVIYKQGSTFGEIWEGLMSSKENYTVTQIIRNDMNDIVDEVEYVYDPNEIKFEGKPFGKEIKIYKDGNEWAHIEVFAYKDNPISETPAVIESSCTECAMTARHLDGRSLMELQEHTGEELLEWKNTILSDIEWGYGKKDNGKDIDNLMTHYDKSHKVKMELTYNVKQDRTNQIVSIGYLYDHSVNPL